MGAFCSVILQGNKNWWNNGILKETTCATNINELCLVLFFSPGIVAEVSCMNRKFMGYKQYTEFFSRHWDMCHSHSMLQLWIVVRIHIFWLHKSRGIHGWPSWKFSKIYIHTWWFMPLSKGVITLVTSGPTPLIPFITRVIPHLLSGMNHQVHYVDHWHSYTIYGSMTWWPGNSCFVYHDGSVCMVDWC